jgi:hypothetical protein
LSRRGGIFECGQYAFPRHSVGAQEEAVNISREVCPFHADDDVVGVPTGALDGSVRFTCARSKGHPEPGPHTWLRVPEPDEGSTGLDSYAAELGLAIELPAAVAVHAGTWIEYGLVERAYALRCPDDFTAIVNRYGHRAISPKRYTASAFLGGVLGTLSRVGTVLYHPGPATGRWSYNGTISWWTVPPAPDWESSRLSWEDSGYEVSYVPGAAAG